MARDIMTAQVVAVKPGTRVPEVAAVDALPCCRGRSPVILELVQADPQLE